MFDHRVQDREELAHHGDQRHFGWFAPIAKPAIEARQRRVPPTRNQRRHVERGTRATPASKDDALPALRATVAIKGGDADQRGDGPSIQGPEFGDVREQRPRGDRANAWHRLQQVIVDPPDVAALDTAVDLIIDVRDPALEPADVIPQITRNRARRDVRQALLLRPDHLEQLASPGDQGRERRRGRVGQRADWGLDSGGKQGQDAGVDRIGFRRLSNRYGKRAHLARIDHDDGQRRGGARCHHGALVSAGGSPPPPGGPCFPRGPPPTSGRGCPPRNRPIGRWAPPPRVPRAPPSRRGSPAKASPPLLPSPPPKIPVVSMPRPPVTPPPAL